MNDSWQIADRITDLIQALEACPMVDIVELERAPGISQAELDAVHAELGWTLDPSFTRFFRANDGLRLTWVDARGPDDGERTPRARFEEIVTEDRAVAGAINVPPLRTTVFDHGHYEHESDGELGRYTTGWLGGWDDALLRRRVHPLDDFLADETFGSYYEPVIVVDPLYPHPPVLIAEDHRAGFASYVPMPAGDYLDFVVATTGMWWTRRQRLYTYDHRGVDFFVPPAEWLRGMPDASAVLDMMLGHDLPDVAARVDALCTVRGQPVASTPFAAYVDGSQTPPAKAVPQDTPPFDIVHKDDLGSPEYWDGLQPVFDALPASLELAVPRLERRHYRVDQRIRPSAFTLAKLVRLVGAGVIYETDRKVDVGCLLSVKPSGIWTYGGTLRRDGAGAIRWGSYSYRRVPLEDLVWLGRAVPAIDG